MAIGITTRSILFAGSKGSLGCSEQSDAKSIDFGATVRLATNLYRAGIPEFSLQLSLPARDRDDNIVNTSSLP